MRRHANPRCTAEVTAVHFCSPVFLTPLPISLCLKDVPAQPVDATPSSALIRQCFRGRTTCLAVLALDLARVALLLVSPLPAILAFIFNAKWAGALCCVDRLRSPELSERKARPSGKFPVTRLSRNLSDKLSGINK